MKFLNSGNIVRLPLDQIEVAGRLREVRDAFVENLMVMAEDTGITTPIHVRKTSGRHVLIDGAHRLEAARRMGLSDIAALVVECRADEARAMEATNNLGAARMTPLQTVVFVASWHRDYYAMHPERKPGGFQGNQHTGNLVGGIMPLTTTIADAFGVDVTTVKRALRAGRNLSPEEAAELDRSPARVTMKDLQDLSKIGDADERRAVVLRLASGNAKSAAAARRTLAAENGSAPIPLKDPVEEALKALRAAWSRAPKSVRRRFVSEVFDDLSPLVVDEAELRDADEIAAMRGAAE